MATHSGPGGRCDDRISANICFLSENPSRWKRKHRQLQKLNREFRRSALQAADKYPDLHKVNPIISEDKKKKGPTENRGP
ncbi:hypothetical protein [Agrobacterium tumefaciens]|uniref:hypothetical protein n=1 Tax=Agrobacterium tumefaciens TaxID=358 RepID=UPI00287D7393|nr:hypothetical protein [Agrobacterium tumefaciens]MDS7594465.1 hypothetical protein [Agrobacterium tumefaciens]